MGTYQDVRFWDDCREPSPPSEPPMAPSEGGCVSLLPRRQRRRLPQFAGGFGSATCFGTHRLSAGTQSALQLCRWILSEGHQGRDERDIRPILSLTVTRADPDDSPTHLPLLDASRG